MSYSEIPFRRPPADALLATLKDLSGQLPDEGLALLEEVEVRGMVRDVLAKLLDGLAAQCKATRRSLGAANGFAAV